MADMTIHELRGIIDGKLAEARGQIKKWEEYLALLDSLEHESGGDAKVVRAVGVIPSPPPLVGTKGGAGKNTGGRALRELMIRAEGDFNVPGIVKAVQSQIPEIPYEALSRRASAIAYRLLKAKKIKVVKAGAGREPHTYRRTGK
jgi:hypothetical protein